MFPKRLSEGYQSFLEGRFPSERSRYEKLAESGQSPEILIIGCCDSRVSPEVIFDAGPGEMFVVRNVANLVPPCDPDSESSYHGTSAAIEFAVNALNVKHIVVLGHASCGGIRAFYDDAKPLTKIDFIGKWMSQIAPVAERLGPGTGDRNANIKRLELAVIEHSLQNLMTFPAIRRRVEKGELELHGTYFGVATGVLFLRDPKTGEFHPCLETGAPA
ncbi:MULTISPECIES: carbonic anhydrase [unclassified Achromobacter]|jgi:carbonic anhydrase|uniref:carbonic anhydrase n=1 Tax=unclassified Achromobacter TaxID=2626865 RepID=UPI00069E42E1|nr:MULTISPECIES: carbonic anhydrase [unclassified Achromobacter]KOF55342.1 carbonate dehydratase [Achromobacter sp. DMS1]